MSDLIFIMYSRGSLFNGIRGIFNALDMVAYTLFSWVIQLIFDIVSVSGSEAFNNFYDGIYSRIYAVLVIFMLFKITISMLTYLVNPDSISDKSQGIGKLSSRIVISLVMLIAFPMAFQFLNRVQPHIIEALPRIILGTEAPSNSGEFGKYAGEMIAFQSYYGVFIYPKDSNDGLPENEKTFEGIDKHLNDPGATNSEYKYEYKFLVGFVVGTVMTLIMLGYCVDMAIRVFKLIILQAIAPIPIISYIDPKSSKDGAFHKWFKMVISVWTEVFIKLGVIYFVLLVIKELIANDTIKNIASGLSNNTDPFRTALVMLALIIGLLFFAKGAPKFICDALGIKSGENGKLFGGLGKIMAAGAIGAGAIGSAIASGKASYLADDANGKNHNALRMMKNVGAGLFGGVTGLKAGTSAAVNAKDHYAQATRDALAKRNATVLAAGAAGSTALGRFLAGQQGLWLGETAAEMGKREIAGLEAQKAALETVKSRVSSEMVKKDWTYGNLGLQSAYGDGNIQANFKSFKAAKDAAVAAGQDYVEFFDIKGRSQIISMEEANMQEGFLLKNNESNYIEQHVNGSVAANEVDHILMADIDNANKITKKSITNRNDVTTGIDETGVKIMNAKRENAKKEQNARFSGSGK